MVTETISVIQGLYFGGSAVVNHGIVTLDQITNTASTALLCVTPAADCCTLAGSGDWFSPSGSVITTSTSSATYQVKGSFFVDLRRSSGGVEGIYRCDIRLSAGAARTSFYVGLYLAGSGFVSIDALQFNLTSALTADPPVFTLTCVSTGGPATTVTWTRDEAAVSGVNSQTVTSMLTATYVNTLTVTGRLPGNYRCSVTNEKNTADCTLTVQGGVVPSGVSAAQDGTTITVSWTPPSPAPSAGYMVYYSTTGDEGSVSVSSGSDSQAVITGRQADRVYTVSVVAVSDLPSALSIVPALRPVPYVELNGQVLPNNSLVVVSDIVADAARTLRCVTPRTDCCSDADTAVAQWYHHDGRDAGAIRFLNRLSSGEGEPLGSVALVRANSNNEVGMRNEGIYRCTVPLPGTTANPSTISYYIGLYNPGNGELQPITDAIQFALVSSSPVQFTLTCISTGGPATSVTWTRNGGTIPYDGTHVLSQTVVDASRTARYNNTLTVTVVESGHYQCTISNVLSTVQSAVLSGDVPSTPSVVIIVPEATGSSVRVTWTAPTENAELLGYLVSFERLTGRGCDSLHNDTYSVSSTTTNYTIMGLSGLSTYSLGVAAVNIFGSSDVVTGAIDIHPSSPTGPPADITTATNGSSITVRWSPVPCLQRNSQITGYIVRYTEVTRSRTTSADINVTDGSTTSITIDGLQGSTHYSIEVAAVGAGETGVFSSPITANTTAPSPSSGGTEVNAGAISGGSIAAIVVVLIAAGVPVLVWLVLKHRKVTVSLQDGSQNLSEFGVFGNKSQDTFKNCNAYGVTSQPVEEENYSYVTLPGRPIPPARGSSPTSTSQMNKYYDITEYENAEEDPALQDHRAVISGQTRSTAPSHSPPQEPGGDEHIYEPTYFPASTTTPITATPTTVPVTLNQKK